MVATPVESNPMLYPTHLFRRGDIFYYRAKVPTDLREHLKRREIWISLKTSDRPKADLRLAETHAQQLRTYDCLRQGLTVATTQRLLNEGSSYALLVGKSKSDISA